MAELIDITAEDDKIVLRFESKGITNTGERYDQVYCFAMVMKYDRITEIIAYLDTALLDWIFS